ncbi:Protein PHO-14, partial [Aphelenchoides avenae]
MIDKMKQKVYCHEHAADSSSLCKWIGPLKYYAYSGHDSTIIALLATLGDEEEVLQNGFPHYTASVAMELWNTDRERESLCLQ